ncbi:MAG: helix-turn-helix domain-containing protein [Methylocella sp.]
MNALVLLDDGLSFEEFAKALFVNVDTVRGWFCRYEEGGINGLAWFGLEGSACQLSGAQQDKLKAWIAACLRRAASTIGAFIETEIGFIYDLQESLRTDRASASPWARIPLTEGHPSQARRNKAEDVHRVL